MNNFSAIQMIDTQMIIPGPNDRTVFNQDSLQELAANIADNGLIQPITVRWIDDADMYQIVAGERRFRACTAVLDWKEIPAIVKDLDDLQASAIMLAENIARANLDPIDEGRAYASRMTRFSLSVSEIADQAGVTPVRVHFRLKLLKLREDVQRMVRSDNLSIGYAQILADADLDHNRQMLAVSKLRDNSHATPSWFRQVVNELLKQQAQGVMFDLPLMGGEMESAERKTKMRMPPTPSDTTPPTVGNNPKEIVGHQAGFWQQAADSWNQLGKPFKRQECEAAAKALQFALSVL